MEISLLVVHREFTECYVKEGSLDKGQPRISIMFRDWFSAGSVVAHYVCHMVA